MKGTQHRNGERGIALLAVVAVLVLLAIIATPFLVTMRDGAERGKAVLAATEATWEAENVFRVATSFLGSGHDSVERWAKDEKVKGQPSTPDWDTADEFQVPASLLAAAGLDPETGRIWGVSVEDESGKIDVNSAPFTLLAHFFGKSRLAQPLEQDATEAILDSDGGLPARDGVLRLGDEVVRYQAREGTVLRGLQRGYLSDRAGNGPPRKHGKGELVVNEVAFQIAAYPILARRGKMNGVDRTEFAPFSNLYEIRRISDLGVAALPAADWERVVDNLTVSSRGVTGLVFADPQNLREPVKAGSDGHRARLRLDNPYRFGIGTVVRISDGSHTDYGVVYGIGGGSLVEVVPATLHDYDVNITRVESLVRRPVNVNTASEDVLAAVHEGIASHGQTPIAGDTARTVAARLVKERSAGETPGIHGLKAYGEVLEKLVVEGSLRPEERDSLEMNALNPLDSAVNRLALGTVPFVFKSGGTFTVTARAVVLDRTGKEVGRREFRRLVDVTPQGPAVYEAAGQDELDELVRVAGAKYFSTFPVNVAYAENPATSPVHRFPAFFKKDRWPSTDRSDPTASLRYGPSRPDYDYQNLGDQTLPDPFHFDDEDYADGKYMHDSEVTVGVGDARVAAKDDHGLEAFAAGLWFKPYWGGRRTSYILDSGKEEWEDRFALFYDGDRRELVFRVKDTSLQRVASEVRYAFDASTFEDDTWYHLLVTATGGAPGQMSLFVDGVRRGKPTLMTWTTQAIDGTGDVATLPVEDASTFPDRGAVLLRGPEGVEVFDYESKTASGLKVSRRFSRMNRADTVDDANATTVRSFPQGTAVVLYGYSVPTASRIPEGEGELAAALGRFNVFLLDSQNPPDGWPNPSAGGGGGGGGGTVPGGGGGGVTALVKGWRGPTVSLSLSSDLHGWDGLSGADAALAFGKRGYAILASGDGTYHLTAPEDTTNEPILDAELVTYVVNGDTIVLTRKPEPTTYLAGGRFDKKGTNATSCFIPQHSYGNAQDPGLKSFFSRLPAALNGHLYADEARITEQGFISVLIPISVEVANADRASFLDPNADVGRIQDSAYLQIGTDGDTEWVKYDGIEQLSGAGGSLQFVRDRSVRRTLALFRHLEQGTRGLANPTDPPPPDDGGGPDDGGDDQPPAPEPPPPDDGPGGGPDTPPPPPDPGPGEDDGPGGTPDQPPVPPDPGPGEDDGPGGDPDRPPDPTPGPGEDDGPGGEPDQPPMPPEGGGEDDGGGGTPDTPPEGGTPPDGGGPPPDGGGTPDGGNTDDPGTTTGGGNTAGGGGSGTVGGSGSGLVPYPIHEIAKYLDTRSTLDENKNDTYRSVWTGDLANKVLDDGSSHEAGSQVLPCFLVAFPGVEYDPQGNGSVVVEDLEAILAQQASGGAPGTAGGGPTAGGSGGAAGQVAGRSPGSSSSGGTSAQGGKVGDTGDKVDPGSASLLGPWVEPGPGQDDVVTVVVPGEDGFREEHAVNWSHRSWGWSRSDGNAYRNNGTKPRMRSWTWVAFKEPVSQEVDWSRGLLSGSDPASAGSDALRYAIGSLADRRSFVRLVKSPSGELPSRVDDAVHVGASWNGGSFAPAVVDELRFATARSTRLANRRNFRLGLPPVAGARGAGIGPDETTIPLHLAGGYTVAAALPGVRTSGGLLRIDDEIIGYADYDASTQSLTGCKRGMLGSEARDHSYAAAVSPVFGLPVARLEEAVTETSSRFVLSNYRGFPVWGGFARVGDEIVGYTRIDQNVLVMPEGRQVSKDGTFDPYADTNAGAGLFRGRYGTEATSHEAGEIVVCIDHRYPDMVREKADNSQMAFLQVGREVKGALWKRVSWDQRLRSLNGIRVLVRFEGGPGWDTDRIVRLDTDPVPDRDRHRWIYEVTDPLKLNLLNVQSDRIECRVFFTYEKGSFNPTASPAPDAWKETPWLQAFRIEYVAPSGVLTTEDLR